MEKVIYQTYPHWYEKMNEFIKENATHPDCEVCFLGDSIVEMADVKSLNDKYYNRGIISDKTHGLLISLDDRVIALNPKKVVVSIGSNDVCDGYLIKTIEDNLMKIIDKLLEKGIQVIVATITPPCYYKASHVDHIYPDCRDITRIKEYNNFIRNLKNVTVFDAYKIVADENDSLRIDETLDGVHLSKKAYDKIFKELIKIL